MIDLSEYGAVYGQVDQAQKLTNMDALEAAIVDADAGDIGEIRISGVLMVQEPVTCLQGKSGIHISGDHMRQSSIYYQTAVSTPYLVDLTDASFIRITNLGIDGRWAAQVGLYCNRDAAIPGNHHFEQVFVTQCTHVSYLSMQGADGTTHIGCHFIRSPVGALITACEPIMNNVPVPGMDPVVWDGAITYTPMNHFVGCAFGDGNLTTRCGLMICKAQVHMSQCKIQAKADGDSEAYIICDGTGAISDWSGLYFDSGLAPIAIKFGYYAEPHHYTANRVNLRASHLTIHNNGQHFITGKNVRNSNFGPIGVGGPIADFEFESATCFNNEFTNCRHLDGTEIEINY